MSAANGGESLQFLGAAGTVTGSKFLIRSGGRQLLLDCGLFQGLRELRRRNWEPRFDARAIDAVVLTHAHIDHSGHLPVLVRAGFRGAVHCTAGTADLLEIMLRDAAKLQEEEAQAANRYGYARHTPALPLFTVGDAEQALGHVVMHPYDDEFEVAPHATALLRRAGHILGSATVELRLGGVGGPLRLVSSGDLGRWNRPILRDPELVPGADVLLVESTYGDRDHRPDADAELARIVHEAIARDGALLVPAFAVGRTQELIWTLRQLEDTGRIPSLPVFVDSPMAIGVTEIYRRHPEDHDVEMTAVTEARDPLRCRQFTLARTPQESKALNERPGPMIIISASGMATGGRILHHLKRRLPDPRTTVLLPGFQAEGTRGRKLQDGATTVRIHGETVPVRAHIETLDGLSAHGDRATILRWLRGFRRPPRATWIIHGEPAASASLAETIRSQLGWREVTVASDGATVPLAGGAQGRATTR